MRKSNVGQFAWPSPASLLLFEIVFLAAYRFGMAFTQGSAAPFWFPDAVLLSALLLSPPNEWWLYILATAPIRLSLFVPPGTPFWFLFACFASDSLKGLLSAWLLLRPSRERKWFGSFREFSRYFLVAVVFTPGLSAFAHAASRSVPGSSFWTVWKIWFFGSALATLLLAPFILSVLDYKRFVPRNPRHVEAFLVALGLGLGTFIAFRGGLIGVAVFPFLLYLPVPFLLWAAMNLGPVGASSSLLLMSALAILETRVGRSPFPLQSPEASLSSMQLFLFFASVPLMFLSVITYQQRKTEAELRDSEQRLRSLVDVGPAMLWMSAADARCTFFNQPWLDFTGLSLKDQTEQDWVACIHPEDREHCVNEYLSAFRLRENFTLEYRLLRSDGTYRWVLHSGVPRYSADGAFLGYVGSRVDFTDRRQAEDHLREMSAQLINAQENERHRIGKELHDDLAQRVCALSIGLSRFHGKYNGNGNSTSDYHALQQQVRDISSNIVRLSHQLHTASLDGLGLAAALRNLCTHATADERVVLFVHDQNITWFPDGISLPLYRIAQESLRNALTHSGATHIQVELSASVTSVRLLVRDNGCGFVVGSVTKRGLGLSGMSERMKSSGGSFSITSSPGEGTAVTATMPLAQSLTANSAG